MIVFLIITRFYVRVEFSQPAKPGDVRFDQIITQRFRLHARIGEDDVMSAGKKTIKMENNAASSSLRVLDGS